MEWLPQSPERLAQFCLAAAATYAYIVILVRLSGKRTASQMNNFDWIVTVAIGSLVASGITGSFPVLSAWATIGVLVAMQWAVTKAIFHSKAVSKAVKLEPSLLLSNGEFIDKAMRKTRVNDDEVRAAVRNSGYGKLEDVRAVILEADGTLSVIGSSKGDALIDNYIA